MYADRHEGWTRQKLASIGLSVGINASIFAGLAAFTQFGGAIAGDEERLAVFALGSAGAEAQQESSAPPPPPPPPPPEQPQSARQHPDLVLMPRPAEAETAAEESPPEPVIVRPSEMVRPSPPVRVIASAQPPAAPVEAAPQQAAPVQTSAATGRSDSGAEGDAYGASVYAHLLRYRAGNMVGPGDVRIRLTVMADGSASDTSVVRSSGSKRFDRAALQMVRRAAPFPRPPDGASHTFDFGIRGS